MNVGGGISGGDDDDENDNVEQVLLSEIAI